MDREALEATRQSKLQRVDQRHPVIPRDERQRGFRVGGEDRLVRADRHVGAEGEEVVVVLAQEREFGAGARGIKAGVNSAFVGVGFVPHLDAAREAEPATVEQAPQPAVGFQVPQEEIRATEPVLVAVDLIEHRGRIGERPVDGDEVVLDLERDREGVERRLVGAGQRPAELRLPHLEAFVLVRLRAGGDQRALPLPALPETPAQTAEHAPSVAPHFGDPRLETLTGPVGVLPGRDAGPKRNVGGRADKPRRAVGVGRAGRVVETHAKRVPRVGGGQVDALVVGVLEVHRLTAVAAVRAVEEQVGEEIDPIVDGAVDEGRELHPVGRRHEHLPFVPVRVGRVLGAVDVGGRSGLLETDASRARPEVEHAVGRHRGDAGGRRGARGDAGVVGRT